LDDLSGVAAILRYPLIELDDIEEEDPDELERQMNAVQEEHK
jgi:hypothetical protein